MKSEEIVQKILSLCPEVPKEKILDRLENERQRTGGLISDEALLRMIAAEFDCKIGNKAILRPVILLGELVPHLADVTVVGLVAAVFPVRFFGETGKFAGLLLVDESGVLRVVLWNDKAALVESDEVSVGNAVRVCHGYTRESQGEGVELHVSEKAEVEVNPEDVDIKDFPTIEKFATLIRDIAGVSRGRRVHLEGWVKAVGQVSTFERRDSRAGKVLRFVLADDSEVTIVVWNEKLDEVQSVIKPGRRIRVINGKVKKSRDGNVEVHVDGSAFVEPAREFVRIADLKEGLTSVCVEGEVVSAPALREVRTAKQEIVKVASFELSDQSGRIWVSAWREHAEIVKCLKSGDRVTLKNVYARKGYTEQLELSTRSSSVVSIGS